MNILPLSALNTKKCSLKYLLSVSDLTGGDIEMIGGSAWRAKEFFTLICDGKASFEHLADLAYDYRKTLC